MNRTLELELDDTAHRGAVASQVVLGVAIAAGLTPMAADRRARAVRRACDSASGPLRLTVDADPAGGSVVRIQAAAGGWDGAAPEPVAQLDGLIEHGALVFSLRRTSLHAR